MDVRRATPEDTEALIAMGQAMHAESPRYQGMRFDPAKLRRLAEYLQGTLLVQPGLVLVAVQGGELVGMFVAVLSERWFSADRFVSELAVYVKPEHRGGTAFVRLVRTMERWALAQGVPDIALGVSTGIHPGRTVRAYRKLGYRLGGYTMTKNLRDGH